MLKNNFNQGGKQDVLLKEVKKTEFQTYVKSEVYSNFDKSNKHALDKKNRILKRNHIALEQRVLAVAKATRGSPRHQPDSPLTAERRTSSGLNPKDTSF